MSNMPASGLGVDSSSSMTFPFPTGAGYCRTDEEEGGEEYEVDNCLDYTPEEEDLEMQQTNKLMAAVTNTTTVIQQQTSVTLVLGQDISGEVEKEKEVSLDEEEKQIPGSPALIAAEKTKDTVPARLNSSTATPRDDPVCEMEIPSVGEEIASETPPSGEAHNERAEEATKYLEEATQVPAAKSKSQGPTPSALMPAVATPDTSPKPTQVNTPVTPKKPKRSASKKRKTPPKRNKSGGNRSSKSRRSSQIQHEAPSATCAVPQLADGTEILTHFINLPSIISCNHCGKEIKDSPGNATRHLKSCPVLRTQQLSDAQKEEVVQKDVELPVPVLNRVNTSSGMTLVQLMGTEDLAAKVQGAFASTPFAGDAPISRLDPIVKNDVTGLRHLVVVDLLDAVDPLDGPVLQLQTVTPGVEYCTGHDQLAPLSKAKARALEGNCLRFPAPRTVAEQFISPLAKELGLEYAMNQHTANLVSCPRVGMGLDWRFRQTETVVFLLRGEMTWKLIKGEVDYPLANFEPETWIQEEMDQLATKVYGLTAGRTGREGFLLPPRDDLRVFDEERSGKDGVLEHILKPGSVAYVPASVWFQATTKGENSLWMEVELSSMTCEELMLLALKQLASDDKQARKRIQIQAGNRDQIKAMRCHLQNCMLSLSNEMTKLEGRDLVPEYLCTDDLQDLISHGLIRDVSKLPATRSIEVDLTNPKFKLKREKIFKDAKYRVNPVALLLRADKIPHRGVKEGNRGEEYPSTHQALKKTPKPSPKRHQTLATTSSRKQTYSIDVASGSQDFKLHLHVRCHCSLEQSKFVEWLRSRGGKSFGLEELTRRDDLMQGKVSGRTEETARDVLRFLCFVGYVTLAKFA